jgi:hypothetical protein
MKLKIKCNIMYINMYKEESKILEKLHIAVF